MSQAGTVNNSGGGGGATTYVANVGSATPSLGILNVLGINGTTTSASGNTINISSSFSPNASLQEFDDFLVRSDKLAWVQEGIFNEIDGLAGHPGLLGFAADAGQKSLILGESATGNPIVLGGGILNLNYVINLDTLSTLANRYTLFVGLSDWISAANGVPPVNGVFFSYTDNVNSGNYVLNSTKASVTTSVNSVLAVTTGFVNYGITVNSAGTSISFSINGTLVAGGPITTNIPTVAMSPYFMIVPSAGNTSSGSIDLFYMTYALTTPR